MTDFDADKYIVEDEMGCESGRRSSHSDKLPSASERLAEMTGRPEEEFEAEGYDYPDLDELEEVEDYNKSNSVCQFIQSAMNDGKEELAEKALRTAVEKGWTEAWFQKSSNVTEGERPPLSQRVCEQDFEEWWRMNYE